MSTIEQGVQEIARASGGELPPEALRDLTRKISLEYISGIMDKGDQS